VAGTLVEFLLAWYPAQESHYARYYAGEISFQDQRRERLREVTDPTLAEDAADRIFALFSDAYEANWTLFKAAVPCLDAFFTPHRPYHERARAVAAP